MFDNQTFGGIARACSALALAAAVGLAASTAYADEPAKPGPAQEALKSVPVFFMAGPDGAPAHEGGDASVAYYLTRAQASIAVGLARADRAAAGVSSGDDLHVEASTLADAARAAGPHSFVKPLSSIEAAAGVPGVPLFLVRAADGTPFTVRDEAGHRRVYFYLSEKDAQSFLVRVLNETNRRAEDVQLSIVSLDPVLNTILTSADPLVQNWTIWSSAETRMDADMLKTAAQAQLAPQLRSE